MDGRGTRHALRGRLKHRLTVRTSTSQVRFRVLSGSPVTLGDVAPPGEGKDGSALADTADEQGVGVSDVVDALVTAISAQAAEHDREIDTDLLTALRPR